MAAANTSPSRVPFSNLSLSDQRVLAKNDGHSLTADIIITPPKQSKSPQSPGALSKYLSSSDSVGHRSTTSSSDEERDRDHTNRMRRSKSRSASPNPGRSVRSKSRSASPNPGRSVFTGHSQRPDGNGSPFTGHSQRPDRGGSATTGGNFRAARNKSVRHSSSSSSASSSRSRSPTRNRRSRTRSRSRSRSATPPPQNNRRRKAPQVKKARRLTKGEIDGIPIPQIIKQRHDRQIMRERELERQAKQQSDEKIDWFKSNPDCREFLMEHARLYQLETQVKMARLQIAPLRQRVVQVLESSNFADKNFLIDSETLTDQALVQQLGGAGNLHLQYYESRTPLKLSEFIVAFAKGINYQFENVTVKEAQKMLEDWKHALELDVVKRPRRRLVRNYTARGDPTSARGQYRALARRVNDDRKRLTQAQVEQKQSQTSTARSGGSEQQMAQVQPVPVSIGEFKGSPPRFGAVPTKKPRPPRSHPEQQADDMDDPDEPFVLTKTSISSSSSLSSNPRSFSDEIG